MDSSLLGLMELFIIFAFVLGWAILELVSLRLDKRRKEEAERAGDGAVRAPDA